MGLRGDSRGRRPWRPLASRGVRLRITKGLRHLAKMKAVGTRRKPSERYVTFSASPAIHGGILGDLSVRIRGDLEWI